MEKYVMSLNEFINSKKYSNRKRLFESSDELSKLGIKELKDGLTLEIIKKDHPWLLEKTKFENAVIGKNDKGIVWYSGVWKQGVWKGAAFQGGTFKGHSVWARGEWNTAASWEGAYYIMTTGKLAYLKAAGNPKNSLVKREKGYDIITKGEGVVRNKFRENAKKQ